MIRTKNTLIRNPMSTITVNPQNSQRRRTHLSALLFLAISAFLWAETMFAQQNTDASQSVPLTLNQQFEQVVSPEAPHSYTVSLNASEYFRLSIISTKIDVTVIAPGGQIVSEHACDQRQLTPVSVVAKASGTYIFVLRVPAGSLSGQHYTLRATEWRSVSSSDPIRIEAERSFAEANRLKRKWETSASENALKLFQSAYTRWQSVKDNEGASLALLNLGRTYEALDQTSNALESYKQALTLSESVGDQRRELESLVRIANHYANAGENSLTLEYGDRALTRAHNYRTNTWKQKL